MKLTRTSILHLLSTILLITSVTACVKTAENAGVIKNRSGDFTQQGSSSDLVLPEGVTEVKTDSYYVIPEVDNNNPVDVSIVPPGSVLANPTN